MKRRRRFLKKVIVLTIVVVLPQYAAVADSYIQGFEASKDTLQNTSGGISADSSVIVMIVLNYFITFFLCSLITPYYRRS